MIPYGRQEILKEDIQALAKALKSDLITTGPLIDEFERQLTDYVKCSTFVVNSGTAALHAAYFGIGIGPGDEIITTPNTFIATQATALQLGASVKFADIDLTTGLLSPESVETLISKKSKAIVLVDYAGQPCDVDIFKNLVRGKDIYLVQDAAHSFGSLYNGIPVGSLVDITTFSFFPTKNITTGEGGAVSTNDQEIFQRARTFSRQGIVRNPKDFQLEYQGPWHQEVQSLGLNYRLTDFQCALGISQLSRVAAFKAHRTKLYNRYAENLLQVGSVSFVKARIETNPMWHFFPLMVPAKHKVSLYEILLKSGIKCQVNYMPSYWHPAIANLGYEKGLCPNSESFYLQELSLPIHMGVTIRTVDKICEIISKYFNE